MLEIVSQDRKVTRHKAMNGSQALLLFGATPPIVSSLDRLVTILRHTPRLVEILLNEARRHDEQGQGHTHGPAPASRAPTGDAIMPGGWATDVPLQQQQQQQQSFSSHHHPGLGLHGGGREGSQVGGHGGGTQFQAREHVGQAHPQPPPEAVPVRVHPLPQIQQASRQVPGGRAPLGFQHPSRVVPPAAATAAAALSSLTHPAGLSASASSSSAPPPYSADPTPSFPPELQPPGYLSSTSSSPFQVQADQQQRAQRPPPERQTPFSHPPSANPHMIPRHASELESLPPSRRFPPALFRNSSNSQLPASNLPPPGEATASRPSLHPATAATPPPVPDPYMGGPGDQHQPRPDLLSQVGGAGGADPGGGYPSHPANWPLAPVPLPHRCLPPSAPLPQITPHQLPGSNQAAAGVNFPPRPVRPSAPPAGENSRANSVSVAVPHAHAGHQHQQLYGQGQAAFPLHPQHQQQHPPVGQAGGQPVVSYSPPPYAAVSCRVPPAEAPFHLRERGLRAGEGSSRDPGRPPVGGAGDGGGSWQPITNARPSRAHEGVPLEFQSMHAPNRAPPFPPASLPYPHHYHQHEQREDTGARESQLLARQLMEEEGQRGAVQPQGQPPAESGEREGGGGVGGARPSLPPPYSSATVAASESEAPGRPFGQSPIPETELIGPPGANLFACLLPAWIGESDMMRIARGVGANPIGVRVLRHSRGTSKGLGYFSFRTCKEAFVALQKLDGLVVGDEERAKSGAHPQQQHPTAATSAAAAAGGGGGASASGGVPPREKTIKVRPKRKEFEFMQAELSPPSRELLVARYSVGGVARGPGGHLGSSAGVEVEGEAPMQPFASPLPSSSTDPTGGQRRREEEEEEEELVVYADVSAPPSRPLTLTQEEPESLPLPAPRGVMQEEENAGTHAQPRVAPTTTAGPSLLEERAGGGASERETETLRTRPPTLPADPPQHQSNLAAAPPPGPDASAAVSSGPPGLGDFGDPPGALGVIGGLSKDHDDDDDAERGD
uniref:RRM domain-containing protein n=1 Tax=Chromera velia CCMP2878 TaxID=1169474 RepID=A0A0G4H8C9_9ALVE|eukprot:Cvel_879.t1-p1 / transcript=Cvel_879.t1 / gene=Cvel_879 / organism=Chromera_velia_CCMP2878 / gene_product=hypothetical protein / transcript_product=hypothetical protein / location=Cvel_scaffold27:171741-177460(-) / protein_length=1008 / sequence_SO=supercontig / SO=protein_coding / is_pseudo=false